MRFKHVDLKKDNIDGSFINRSFCLGIRAQTFSKDRAFFFVQTRVCPQINYSEIQWFIIIALLDMQFYGVYPIPGQTQGLELFCGAVEIADVKLFLAQCSRSSPKTQMEQQPGEKNTQQIIFQVP